MAMPSKQKASVSYDELVKLKEESDLVRRIREIAQKEEYREAVETLDKALKKYVSPPSLPPQENMKPMKTHSGKIIIKQVPSGTTKVPLPPKPLMPVTLEQAVAEACSYKVEIKEIEE